MPVTVPLIAWHPSRYPEIEYGMMGSIKAFSIGKDGSKYRLDPHLPNEKGLRYESQEFRDPQKARERADEIREEWRKALATPYGSPQSRAS
ncbi:hypothetical protein [Nonomuraea sp. NPDC050783]|uniref:hypothetical protein n=1 Tax=Nonomuraea sp. NPDC050783 TaxID=3154634 RepID=UPI003466E084